MSNDVKVFFNLRTSSRDRMWDTAREAAAVCTSLTPPVAQQTSLARNQSYKTTKTKLKKRLRNWVRKLPLINHQSVPGSEEADLLYMWGAFPKGSTKPFVIELDNPYVLTYYHQGYFKLRLRALKRKLRHATYITFLSATARNHAIELLGQEFADKCKVLPPYMERNYEKNKRPDDGTVRILFVGFGYRRKGVPELLKAFSTLPDNNARLTVVSNVPEALQAEYAHDSRITFHPPQSRDALFKDFYPTHDIFIFPSLQESLGVVLLEALSYGMGIITTDLYATPELVDDGQNGVLLPHPFLTHTSFNGVPTIDCVSENGEDFAKKYLGEQLFEAHASNLAKALAQTMREKDKFQAASVEKFETTYAPKEWQQKFQLLVTEMSAQYKISFEEICYYNSDEKSK